MHTLVYNCITLTNTQKGVVIGTHHLEFAFEAAFDHGSTDDRGVIIAGVV